MAVGTSRWRPLVLAASGSGYAEAARNRSPPRRLLAIVLDRDLPERFGEIATVRDCTCSWLALTEGTVRPTTWQSFRSHVTAYLSLVIGRILLLDLTTGQMQALFYALGTRLNR